MGLFDSISSAVSGATSKIDSIKSQATQKVNGLKSTAESLKQAGLDKVSQGKAMVGDLKQKATSEVAKVKKLQKVAQDQLGAAKEKFKDGVGVLSDLDLPASAKALAGEALADPSKLGGIAGAIKGAPAGLKGILNDKAGGAIYAVTHFDPAAKLLKIGKAGLLKNGIPTFG